MARILPKGPSVDYFKLVVVLLLFLLLAFDRDLAQVYLLIMFGDFIWWISDNFVSFPFSRGRQTRKRAYIEAVVALGAFLGISYGLISFFSPDTLSSNIVAGTQSIFQLLAASTPILQGSNFLTFLGWGIVVPIIETSFFNGRLLEGLSTYGSDIFERRIREYDLRDKRLWFVIIIVASLFTLFHVTAKSLESLPLLITFIFSVISSVLVIRQKELKGAILLHILTNSLAVASSIGWV